MGCNQSKNDKEETKEEKKEEQAAEGVEACAEETGPRLVVVFGATGRQGGSVVRALLTNDKYKVRAVSRDPEAEKAKALAEKGVEVVKADLDDSESIKKALEGAYGVFGVTDFYAHMDKDKEITQGKVMIDGCKEANVKHLIFSGMESVKELIDKECAHFDSKAEVEKYIKEKEVPCTFVRYSFYYENLLGLLTLKKNDNGDHLLDMPMGDCPINMICCDQSGECIHQIFNNPDEYIGKTIGLSAQCLKVEEYAAILNKAFEDKNIIAGTQTTEDLEKQDVPGAKSLAAMFDFFKSDKCVRDIETTRKLNSDMPAFEAWVDANKEELSKTMG